MVYPLCFQSGIIGSSVRLFREGHVCTECVGRKLATPAIRHRCYRGSYLQTSSVVLSNTYARFRGTWRESIDRYIAVSEFVKRELVKGGFGADQISVKPNSIADTGPGDGAGGYALYVGRLAEEKGIRTMMNAWCRIGKAVPLKVIGVGPLEEFVKQAAAENSAIEPLGWKSISEVCEYLGRAVALIFPSEWLEPFGRSIVEAYSKGTPVIAADTEPIRDIIQERETGLLFEAANSDHLANQVLYLASDTERTLDMRKNARELYLARYSEEQNYQSMMEIFQRVQSSPTV